MNKVELDPRTYLLLIGGLSADVRGIVEIRDTGVVGNGFSIIEI